MPAGRSLFTSAIYLSCSLMTYRYYVPVPAAAPTVAARSLPERRPFYVYGSRVWPTTVQVEGSTSQERLKSPPLAPFPLSFTRPSSPSPLPRRQARAAVRVKDTHQERGKKKGSSRFIHPPVAQGIPYGRGRPRTPPHVLHSESRVTTEKIE